MSQAEELLNSLTEDEIAAYSADYENEPHIVIGSDRFITIPEELKRIAVQYDHDVETVIFDCPRYWDEHDLSEMAIYINYMRSDKYMDSYPVGPISVDGDIIHFSWTISRNVTEAAGQISFLVCAKKVGAEGNESNHWNSELCQDMYVSEGMETEEQPEEMYPDVITELLLRMANVEKVAVTKNQIDAALAEVRTTVAGMGAIEQRVNASASEIRNSYANAIKKSKSGTIITANDVSPLEHDVKVKVHGKNYFNIAAIPTTTASVSSAHVSEVGDDYIVITTLDGYTGNGYCTVPTKVKEACPALEVGKTYILSADTESDSSNIYLPGIQKSWLFHTPIVMTEEILNSSMTLYGFSMGSGLGPGDCRISNIQIEEGSIATDYEPYIDPTTVTVTSCGKNMLELSGSKSQNGVTMTVSDSDLVTVSGTTTASINLNVGKGFMKAGYKYKPVIQFTKGDTYPSYWSFESQSNMYKDSNGYLSSDVDTEFSAFIYAAGAGVSYDSSFRLMVKLVDDGLDDSYESYSGMTNTPEEDGTCTVKSVSPNMTIFANNPSVTIEAEYNRDMNVILDESGGLPAVYQKTPAISSNLISGDSSWTSSGWTGSAASGWTHTSGNTSQLKVPVSIKSGTYYVIEFDANADIADNALTVTLGGSDAYSIYWGGLGLHYFVGVKTVNTSELTFIPASNYTGTIKNITVKEILAQSVPYLQVRDSTDTPTLEIRPTNSDRDSLYIGASSGGQDIGSNGNIGIGIEALSKNVSGFWNTAIGRLSLRDNVGGTRNTAIGQSALLTNLYGHRNVAIGSYVLNANKTGNWNVGVGVDALYDNTVGNRNVGVGFMALTNLISGNENVAVGPEAAHGLTTGSTNVAIGASAMLYCTTGTANMAIGNSSLYRNSTGSNNVAIGSLAGRGSGNAGKYSQNIFIGSNSAKNITDGCTSNVIIGTGAAATLTSGANCIVIGCDCDIPAGSYKLNIGDLIKGSMLTSNKYLEVDGGMQINALPTSDPAIAGRLWNDNGTVKVSAG